jgi:precorrin-2 dehydrogenase/sirohydrochlorin ferrochelatase
MIPLLLDPAAVRIGLVGDGPLCVRRLAWLREGGAEPQVWSPAASAELARAAPSLAPRLPQADEIADLHVLWIADIAPDVARPLTQAARAARVLVNLEDVLDQCDFHTPSVLRRGRLTLSAGTGGASPAAAGLARARLAEAFPEAWGEALEAAAAERDRMRAEGASPAAIKAAAEALFLARGLI